MVEDIYGDIYNAVFQPCILSEYAPFRATANICITHT